MAYILLTTKPEKRIISVDHSEWIYVLPTKASNSVYLYAKMYYTDGLDRTEQLSGLQNLRQWEAVKYNLSYHRRNYHGFEPTKTIASIEIFIALANEAPLGPKLTLIPKKYLQDKDTIRAIYYNNSLGGVDSMICTGEPQKENEYDSITSEKAVELEFGLNSEAPIQDSNQEEINRFKMNTGFKTKGEIQAFNDFFLLKSGFEYRLVNGNYKLIPIRPVTNRLQLPDERANLQAIPFTYEYAFKNRAIDQYV